MRVQCSCGAVYQLKSSFAGKRFACKKCGAAVKVPMHSRSTGAAGSKSRAPEAATRNSPRHQPQRPKSAAELKAEREEALLAKYSEGDGSSLEDRIAERQRERIEDDRYIQGAKHIIIGVVCLAFAVGAFLLFHYLEQHGGVVPRIVAVLFWLGGKWWVPAVLALIGAFQLFIGIGSCMKVVDIDEQEDF